MGNVEQHIENCILPAMTRQRPLPMIFSTHVANRYGGLMGAGRPSSLLDTRGKRAETVAIAQAFATPVAPHKLRPPDGPPQGRMEL